MHTIIAAVVGYLTGVFTPAVSRKVKSYFSKEATKAKAVVVDGSIAAVVDGVKAGTVAAVTAVETKL